MPVSQVLTPTPFVCRPKVEEDEVDQWGRNASYQGWSDPGFLPRDSPIFFCSHVYACIWALAAWHPCETFHYLVLHSHLSLKFSLLYFSYLLLSLPLTLISCWFSHFLFSGLPPSAASTRTLALRRSGRGYAFYPSFHSVVHLFVNNNKMYIYEFGHQLSVWHCAEILHI